MIAALVRPRGSNDLTDAPGPDERRVPARQRTSARGERGAGGHFLPSNFPRTRSRRNRQQKQPLLAGTAAGQAAVDKFAGDLDPANRDLLKAAVRMSPLGG
jgi:hypothetical protein